MYSLIIAIGFVLDLIFGDPEWSWHPVRIIGRLIERLETKLNKGKTNKKLSGVALVILVVGLTIFCVWGSLGIAKVIHPVLYYVVSVLFIYFALSIKDLAVEANKVYKALKMGNIKEARRNLSMIVGRDTDKLDEPQIIRAAVETVAESIMDGIIAPLFYVFLGGPILAWAYKAINTLDSMVGHKNERLADFGWASAKLDGILNFIPSKIAAFLISFSAFCHRKNWIDSIRLVSRYLFEGTQHNSEMAEASMAGALGIQLGGLNFYSGKAAKKALLGDAKKPLETSDIKDSVSIAYLVSLFGVLIGEVVLLLIK